MSFQREFLKPNRYLGWVPTGSMIFSTPVTTALARLREHLIVTFSPYSPSTWNLPFRRGGAVISFNPGSSLTPSPQPSCWEHFTACNVDNISLQTPGEALLGILDILHPLGKMRKSRFE
jgi:hypothetical protein